MRGPRDTFWNCSLKRRISLLLAAVMVCLAMQSTSAASMARVPTEEVGQIPTATARGGSRSAKTKTTSVGKGPRGKSTPTARRRHLQNDIAMVGESLAGDYGGSGGPSMTGPIPDMRPQVVPIVPTPFMTTAPTADPREITFLPGSLTVMEQDGDLILSQGLTSRLIAISGEPVMYADGTSSAIDFHDWPDGAATFPDNRPNNLGGWIYVSNKEDKPGGVGAITFDQFGNILDYKMILEDTLYNCNGGKTPWDTWISAEEDFDKEKGKVWQVDPYGVRPPEVINMGNAGGAYEAFAYDVRDQAVPRFFLTEDSVFGAVERFSPMGPNWADPWQILLGPGVHQWLLLNPNPSVVRVFDQDDERVTTTPPPSYGTYSWTTDHELAKSNAAMHYPQSEGIDVSNGKLFFVCKGIKMLFTLDLDGNTYVRHSTDNGLFEGEPDTITTILSDENPGESLLLFSEDNGRRAGVHARGPTGELMTILEGFYEPETTGLAVSPNGMFLYVCFQEDGYCFAISRTDGLTFGAKTLNVKRHTTEGGFSATVRNKETRKTFRERRFV